MSNIDLDNISFDLPKNQSNVIKVIGVGGGGSNAINHMFSKGIKGVDFVVCNTDAQALHNSPVPTKIQLGATLTEGLGAGANPTVGKEAALESIDEIRDMLDNRSKMLFITVGMGGGTGTGAAPIIAKIAKEMEILTVGIVTTPFSFEGKMRNEQAQLGIEKLRKHVDSLVVINNNKLREVYGNLGFKAGFSKADEVLATAATGIAQVITHHYTQNIDLKDAKTVLSSSGTAIMGSGTATGTNRAQSAITKALDSPLLNDNKITGAKRVLLLIVSGTSEVTIDEIGEINDYIQSEAKTNVDIIMGVGEDENLGESISVTVIATGFNIEQQNEITNTDSKKIVHNLVEEKEEKIIKKIETPEVKKRHTLHDEIPDNTPEVNNLNVVYEKVEQETDEVIQSNDDEFIISSSEEENKLESESKIEEISKNQFKFTFDLPIQKEESVKETITKDIQINEIEIIGLEEIKPKTLKDDKVRHSLEMEDEFAQELKVLNEMKEHRKDDNDLKIELKVNKTTSKIEENISENIVDDSEVSPLNLTISELKKRAEDRRNRMKDFNYKFINKVHQNIDEMENQPAYKRLGLDIDTTTPSTESQDNKSRTSLGLDDNNDIQIRSNNSFLHDNVD
ncbi:MAG: cell division protein FtsZ [Bacteroidota bacterium]